MADTVLYSNSSNANPCLVLFDRDGVMSVNLLGVYTTIGRSCIDNDCDIRINSGIVSRKHGEIILRNGAYFYKDTESTNGTYVNKTFLGEHSASGESFKELTDGSVLAFDIRNNGEHHEDAVFGIFTYSDLTTKEWTEINLNDDIVEICVGRSVKSGLKIDNDMISEKHASFFCSKNGWAIIDHHSTNGVFLNDKKLSAPRYLDLFDVVRIVDTLFIYMGDRLLYSGEEKSSANPVVEENKQEEVIDRANYDRKIIEGSDLVINIVERSVIQRFKKLTLLQDINLTVANGEMVLILGGSGAGKTTFINAVMGYEKASGTITYNDTDIYEEYEQMKYEIGFVPQQDLLRGSDTVYSTISNAAQMKLPRSMDEDRREERIDKVLEELGLSRERNTLVSKLSGGQRKRLSIAIEFIANPSLFFLDEPDSGVDDIMGRGLMENLRNIADQGKIVMVITHSPERAADLFDKVIVLAKSTKDNCGHLAYYGTPSEAFKFFGVSCFRDIVRKINRPDENGEGLSDYFIEKYADMQRYQI